MHDAKVEQVCVGERERENRIRVAVEEGGPFLTERQTGSQAKDWMDWRAAMSYMTSHVVVVDTLSFATV